MLPEKRLIMIANNYLGWLYICLRFHFGCKLKLPNGELLRRGVTTKKSMYTALAVPLLEQQRLYGCRLLNKMYGNEIFAATGRLLQLPEVRMSFQPEFQYWQESILVHGMNGVFLDDVREDISPAAHLMIETSPGNWQAHFRITDELCNDDEIKCIQKYLRHRYNADEGAVSAKHPRRFASPLESGLQSVVRYTAPLNTKKLLAEAKDFAAGQPQSYVHNFQQQSGPVIYQQVSEAACDGVWQRALDRANQDRSNADFALGIYLAARGYGVDEIQEAIIRVRGDELFRKKGSDTERYLEHTAERAVEKFLTSRVD